MCKKHAEAVRAFCDVKVLYVQPDEHIEKQEIVCFNRKGFEENQSVLSRKKSKHTQCKNQFYKVFECVSSGYEVVRQNMEQARYSASKCFYTTALIAAFLKFRTEYLMCY